MKKTNLPNLFKKVQATVSEHSPEILTGIGIAGMITTTVLAVKVTPKALMLLEDAQYEKGGTLTASEKAKVCWRCYAPAAISGTFSIACLIGANSVNARRNAALATAYKLSETALTEYRDKVVETIGEKKEKTIREKIDKDRVEKNPVNKHEVIITGKGTTLCLDTISGRYFESDIEKIRKAVNELNRRMTYDVYVSLNEFYDELDLDHTVLGDDLGWNLDDGLIDIDFSSQLTSDERPCIVVNYRIAPRYGYSKFL